MSKEKLSIEEMIGQRFIFGVNDHNVLDVVKLVRDYHLGGIILYRRNYRSYEEMLEVIKKYKNANKDNKIPLFISIDQEGGRVNRIPDEIHNLKNIYEVSRLDSNLVSEYADIISLILSQSGINMDFAPVMDIYNNSKSNALYKRCFYGDSDAVYEMGKVYTSKMQQNDVLAVIKHFPGHGITKRDSHFFIPFIMNHDELFNKHIVPFDKMVESKVDALMVGHMIVRGETNLLPASISDRFIKKYLRDKEYDNLIITDEVNMLKKQLLYHFNYINKSLKASSDIILAKIKDYDEGARIINSYRKMIENDHILHNNLEDSVKRIVRIKKKYNINDATDYKGIDIDKINKRIDKINERVNGK